ncbi:MAG: Wzz/FepE/Etk N-terminal domain-containing protein [Oscillospiraceae bacterium]|nr:Wzz/FepE/Etk N-terminal domain-containing protein [Oscillospiraceae bacterium]
MLNYSQLVLDTCFDMTDQSSDARFFAEFLGIYDNVTITGEGNDTVAVSTTNSSFWKRAFYKTHATPNSSGSAVRKERYGASVPKKITGFLLIGDQIAKRQLSSRQSEESSALTVGMPQQDWESLRFFQRFLRILSKRRNRSVLKRCASKVETSRAPGRIKTGEQDMELSLKDLFHMFIQRIWIILLAAVCGGAIAFALTYSLVTPMYTASASMYVSNNEDRQNDAISNSDLSASQSLVGTYIVVLKSDTLLEKVAEKLPLEYGYSAALIRQMLSAGSIDGTQAFQINIVNSDPERAMTIVNTIAAVAPDEIIRVVKAGEAEVIDYAQLPTAPYWPLKRNAAVGILLGLALSMAGILSYNVFDVTVHTAADLTDYYDLPVLGEIPCITPTNFESERKRNHADETLKA